MRVLHWGRAGGARRGVILIALAACVCASGCRPKPRGERAAAKQTEPEKKNEDPPLAGEVRGLDLTLTDKNGVIIARIKAQAGLVGRTGTGVGDVAGATTRTEATLHDKGKPTVILTARRIRADQATRSVTGEGDVIARSLVQPGSPTVRADRMTWRPGQNTIRGAGNVLLTRDGFRMPGTSFVADTRLRTIEVSGSDAPIAGRLPQDRR
jgi:hypothetical protein